ncbi:MAG: hypothetical protein ACREUX_21235 [Burkholderiales bacterium]
MDNCGGRAATGMAAAWVNALCALVAITTLAGPAWSAERDICENKAGPELIRCIEAAARSGGPAPSQDAAKAAPTKRSTSSSVVTPVAPAFVPPRAPAEDCTGRSGEALRRCLAAGGRLNPDAFPSAPTVPAAAAAPTTAPARAESCEGKSGEALRLCVEAQSKDAGIAAAKPSQPQVIPCSGYTAVDQPLCLHRNSAIVECRKRNLYPDVDVCLRSHMARAPQPARADCGKLQARLRAHCEARNRVYAACSGDKMGYFACLERQLGSDAVLTRR